MKDFTMSLYIRCKRCGRSYISQNNDLSGICKKCSGTKFEVIWLKTTDSIYGENHKTFPDAKDKIEKEYNLKDPGDIERFKKIYKNKTAMYSIIGLDDEVLYIGQSGNIVNRINTWRLLKDKDELSPKTWFIDPDEVREVYIFITCEIKEKNGEKKKLNLKKFKEWESEGYMSGGLLPLSKPIVPEKLAKALESAAIKWFNPVFNSKSGTEYNDIDIDRIFFYEVEYIRLKYAQEVSINQRLQNKLEFLKEVHENRDKINPDLKRLRIHYKGLSELSKRLALESEKGDLFLKMKSR